jgi:thioredoxin 1
MNSRDIYAKSYHPRPHLPESPVASVRAGRYKPTMASANIKELTDANFETEVLKADVPTLVDFWAVWCGPCKQIAPTVDALADEYKGRVKVAKMDVDHHQIVPQNYGIRSIPTLLIFKGGKVVGQLVGAANRAKIEAELQKHL